MVHDLHSSFSLRLSFSFTMDKRCVWEMNEKRMFGKRKEIQNDWRKKPCCLTKNAGTRCVDWYHYNSIWFELMQFFLFLVDLFIQFVLSWSLSVPKHTFKIWFSPSMTRSNHKKQFKYYIRHSQNQREICNDIIWRKKCRVRAE